MPTMGRIVKNRESNVRGFSLHRQSKQSSSKQTTVESTIESTLATPIESTVKSTIETVFDTTASLDDNKKSGVVKEGVQSDNEQCCNRRVLIDALSKKTRRCGQKPVVLKYTKQKYCERHKNEITAWKKERYQNAVVAKKQAKSREDAGVASRSSYRDAQSFLRSLYKLDDTANPYYHGFGTEMEHQFIVNWVTKSYNGRRGWVVFGNCLQNDGTTEFPSASEIIPMVEWNGKKLSKLCGNVKLERGAFPPDADRPKLPPRRPPGPTIPNTASSVSPFGGSHSAILEGDVSLRHAMIIASALNNNSMGGVDLNAHLGSTTSQQGPTHITKPPAVPVLYFKRESDGEMLEVPPLLVNGVTLSVESCLSDAAEIAHKMSSGPAVLAKKRGHDTFLTIQRPGLGIPIVIADCKRYKIKDILDLEGVESDITIMVEWKKAVELTASDRLSGVESLF
eukprot:scaffold89075_cov36-Attheya_sp.AAC.1